ncbi:MAG: sugar ABC transporter ATP-binding protein [Lachnospiraceae bacterium]|nr:sugar ABC transporter ATP-binding protein [Lachnospiraceae bacterium]
MLLRTKGISKQFNGIYALNDVDLKIKAGEVHGLVGENGAGKSTLIKILTAVYKPDNGTVIWDGTETEITDPLKSRNLGINVIHQDRQLIPSFNGIENAYLGLDYEKKRGGIIDWEKMKRRVLKLSESLGIEMDFTVPASLLSPPQQTLLCIIRALMTECRLLILDEPTASLTDKETAILFRIIGKLKEKGTSVLYVTHRLEEIFFLTDRITVMKNGRIAGTVDTSESSEDMIIRMMTDNWESRTSSGSRGNIGESILKAEHISSKDGIVKDMSIDLKKGEILGIFGLGGSGRTEFLETLYGLRPKSGGGITLYSEDYPHPTPKSSIQKGMVLINEDRRKMSLIMPFSIRKNITLPVIDKYSKAGVIDEKSEEGHAAEKLKMLDIKSNGTDQAVSELSGGNQQKVVFARALESDPKVFLCDEPTQAVDVKTRYEIHRLLRDRADSGCGVVFVSSDLKEVLEVSDEIQIIVNGRSRELLKNRDLSSEDVLRYCYLDR